MEREVLERVCVCVCVVKAVHEGLHSSSAQVLGPSHAWAP